MGVRPSFRFPSCFLSNDALLANCVVSCTEIERLYVFVLWHALPNESPQATFHAHGILSLHDCRPNTANSNHDGALDGAVGNEWQHHAPKIAPKRQDLSKWMAILRSLDFAL